MKGSMRKMAKVLGGAVVMVAMAASVSAAYPERPITWVVPYAAGAGTDTVARLLGKAIGEELDQSIIVENRPGAGTRIGAEYVIRSKPDGYTIMTADNATLSINPALHPDLSYDPLKDFTYITTIVRLPLLLVVNPEVPANNLNELIAHARANPGSLNYASPGSGSPHHMAMEMFKARTGINAVHVPYKGAAPALNDVISGQVQMMFLTLSAALPQVKAGRLKIIGAATADRLADAADVPTLAEQGLDGFEAFAWQGVVAPAGTPQDVVEKLSAALNRALERPEIQRQLVAGGLEPMPGTPGSFAEYTRSDIERMKELVKTQNLKADQ